MAKRSEIESTQQSAKGIAKMAEALGYGDSWGQLQFDNGSYASSLIAFLDDNPGACEAILQFVLDHGQDRDGNELEEDEDDEGEEEEESAEEGE